MIDTTPRATACPKDYCRALIPANSTDRAAHLAGHTSAEKTERFIRAELIAIRGLIAELKNDNREFRNELAAIEIPEPTDPLVIEEWPEDELPEDDDETDESATAEEAVEQQLARPPVYTPAPQIDTTLLYPAIDRDEPVPAALDMYGNPIR